MGVKLFEIVKPEDLKELATLREQLETEEFGNEFLLWLEEIRKDISGNSIVFYE